MLGVKGLIYPLCDDVIIVPVGHTILLEAIRLHLHVFSILTERSWGNLNWILQRHAHQSGSRRQAFLDNWLELLRIQAELACFLLR